MPFSSEKREEKDAQWPGMALKRAMRAILKPPSRTTRARQLYCIFVLSSFSPRARQQYLKALHIGTHWIFYDQLRISKDVDDALKIAQLSEKCASCNDCESYPKTPNDAT